MVGVIVISESKAAYEQLKTVKKALGRRGIQGVIPLAIRSDFTRRTLTERVNHAIRSLKSPSGVIILTELYGSTQTNVCLDLVQEGFVEIISGYNLNMLLKAAALNRSLELR